MPIGQWGLNTPTKMQRNIGWENVCSALRIDQNHSTFPTVRIIQIQIRNKNPMSKVSITKTSL